MARDKRKNERRRHPTPERMRRRRRKLLPIIWFVAVCLGISWFMESRATTTVIFVRHTDVATALPGTNDPSLSDQGVRRAELLADFLEAIDVIAGVDAIYVTPERRTRQTAEPLASRLDVDVWTANHFDAEPFMAQILGDHKGEIVLVVTNGEMISPLVVELHGSKNIPEILPDEFGNVYVVTIPWFGKVKTLRLKYDLGFEPARERFSDLNTL
ncbi:MAG TPA: histidine phosphatase family protein [Gammaproteobacteria bacterium]